MNTIHKLGSIFRHFANANTYHRIHSPFVFELIDHTLEDQRSYYSFAGIEDLRKALLNDESLLQVEDHGAGSTSKSAGAERSVASIARTAVSPAYQCQILFKIAHHLKPKSILELGTSLGISAAYLAQSNSNAVVKSIEGSPEIAAIAKSNFKKLGIKNIDLYEGRFDDHLISILDEFKVVDMVYLDGNHQYQASLDYFHLILPYCSEKSVLIFDDIYWSDGMTDAWEEIKSHDQVTQSIDLYYFGLVFFNKDFKEKKHHKVIQTKFKPWQKFI